MSVVENIGVEPINFPRKPSGRSSPYLTKTLFQYVMNLIISEEINSSGEYRSRTDQLPEKISGRSSPYLTKTLFQYVMNLNYFRRNK